MSNGCKANTCADAADYLIEIECAECGRQRGPVCRRHAAVAREKGVRCSRHLGPFGRVIRIETWSAS